MILANNDIELYEHNKDLYERTLNIINTNIIRDILITETMGGGKSFVVMKLIDALKDRYPRVLYIYPSNAIKDNFCSYKEFELIKNNVSFASQHSFLNINNVADYYNNYDLFVYDESHHIGANVSGKSIKMLKDLISKSNNKLLLGLTGTEYRDSDRLHTKNLFSVTIDGNEIIDFIKAGLMPKFDYVICTSDIDKESTIKKLKKIGKVDIKSSKQYIKSIISDNKDRKKWLIFFDNIKRCDESIDYIKSLFPEHKVYVIHSKSNFSNAWIKEINNEEKVVIMSVDKLVEGIHLEGFTAGIIFRNVGSTRLFKQMLGRFNKIGQTISPLIIDCSQAAYRVWRNIIKSENNVENILNKSNFSYVRNLNDKLYSIVSSKYIDINNLLEDIKFSSSIKQECLDRNISYVNYMSYHRYHPEQSIDDYCAMLKRKSLSFNNFCKDNNLNYNNARSWLRNNPTKTKEEYLQYVKNNSYTKRGTIKTKARESGIKNIKRYYYWKSKHPYGTMDEYVLERGGKDTFISEFDALCYKHNIDTSTARGWLKRHPNNTLDDYFIYLDKKRNTQSSLKNVAAKYNVKEKTIKVWLCKHPNKTINDYIRYKENNNIK